MSKKWKIVLGVVVALVIVLGIGFPIAGAVLFRSRFHQIGWEPDHLRRWEPEEARELEVELVDDDGDGVPDRGVIELPTAPTAWRGRFARGHLGRFGLGHGMWLGRRSLDPLLAVRALGHLVLIGGVVLLGIVLYRSLRKTHQSAASEPET